MYVVLLSNVTCRSKDEFFNRATHTIKVSFHCIFVWCF